PHAGKADTEVSITRLSSIFRSIAAILPKRRPGYSPAAAPNASRDLRDQQVANGQREEGEPFDQRGGDDHVDADATAGLRLAGDAFHRLSGQVADAAGGAQHHDPGPDGQAQNPQA